ncbi:transposable element Tc3 transposase [Trichonephila clavipes]|nr:transposable element Tc3 transposase [Trichonephila clavipes]
MARIVRHNDESVNQGVTRNGCKEVKLFTSALKDFQCNNRIVMAQKKHLADFLRGRVIVRLECGRKTSSKYPRNLESPRVSSPGFGSDSKMMVMFSLQSDSRRTLIWRVTVTHYHQENTIERHRNDGAGCLVWGGIILGSRTDLHAQSVTMTGHIYRNVILEQHVRLFRGAIGAEFLFIDDNAHPHRANIVDECLQSED